MLHLVGETIDKHRARYGVETGRLVQIMRGIYIATDDDADAVLFDHALRIALYLYPNTWLCGVSAELLAPTPDRRLFLNGRRNARTRLRNLEIIQTRSPHAPETEAVQITDPFGHLTVRRSTLRFRFLESFRRRSEAGSAMPIEMQSGIAAHLVNASGGKQAAIMECWRLAEANGWRNEAHRAETFLTVPLRTVSPPTSVFHVGWHGEKIGSLSHDGSIWRWEPEPGLHQRRVTRANRRARSTAALYRKPAARRLARACSEPEIGSRANFRRQTLYVQHRHIASRGRPSRAPG